MSEMVGLADIEELLRLTLWSGYLEYEVPVSALVVSDVECLPGDTRVYAWERGALVERTLRNLYNSKRTPLVLTAAMSDVLTVAPAIPRKSGLRTMYELVTDKGTITASREHKFFKLVDSCFVESELGKLDIGDKILYHQIHGNVPDMPEIPWSDKSCSSEEAPPKGAEFQGSISWSALENNLSGDASANISNTAGQKSIPRDSRKTVISTSGQDFLFSKSHEDVRRAKGKASPTSLYRGVSGMPSAHEHLSTEGRDALSQIPQLGVSVLRTSRAWRLEQGSDFVSLGRTTARDRQTELRKRPYSTQEGRTGCKEGVPESYSAPANGRGSKGRVERPSKKETSCSGYWSADNENIGGEQSIIDIHRRSDSSDANKERLAVCGESSNTDGARQIPEIRRLCDNVPSTVSDRGRRSTLAQRREGLYLGRGSNVKGVLNSPIFGERDNTSDRPGGASNTASIKHQPANVAVVLAIRRGKRRTAFDLTVPGTQNFIVAPGFVVHNSGKSELAKLFSENDGVAFPHDATAYGITRAYQRRFISRQIRHIIFPEFIHCLSRAKETVQTFLAFLNGLVAEGVKESHTFSTNFELKEPLSAGVILCITPSELAHWRKSWEGSGFLSRLLPISYSYSLRIENEIFRHIFSSNHTKHQPVMLDLPKWQRMEQQPDGTWQTGPYGEWKCVKDGEIVSTTIPPLLSQELYDTAKLIGRTLHIRGFRPQMQLQKLCLARALSNGRCSVTMDDVIRVQYLASQYLNLNFTEVQ